MYSINYKYVVGEVGSYCQLVVTFFFLVSPYQTRQCSAIYFILIPLSKSRISSWYTVNILLYVIVYTYTQLL